MAHIDFAINNLENAFELIFYFAVIYHGGVWGDIPAFILGGHFFV